MNRKLNNHYNEKRLINPRIPLMIAVIFCFAVFASVNLIIKNYGAFFIALIVLALIILFSMTLFKCLKAKLIISAVLFTFALLGIIAPFVSLGIWKERQYEYNSPKDVLCVSVGEARIYSTFSLLYVDNLIIDGKKISGTAEVLIEGGGYENVISLNPGNGIRLKNAIIVKNELVSDGLNIGAYKNNCKYSITAENADMQMSSAVSPGIFVKIRVHIYNLLRNNMDSDNANIAYSLITGDYAGLSDDVKFNFRITALSHVLSVSGLHISFLIVVLKFLTDKIKINRFVKFGFIAAALLFYCSICSFSAPAMRAVIMGLCSYLAFCLGERSDSLNNISLAAVLILLFKPFYLWDISFILSFLSMLTIILLANPIQMLLIKIKLPKSICGSAAMSLAASIGLMPVAASVFGYFSLFFLITNLLSIPLVMITFISVIFTVLLCTVIPFLTVALAICNTLLHLFKSFLEVFAVMKFSGIMLFDMSSVFAAYFFIIILLSGYVFYAIGVKKRAVLKIVMCVSLCIVAVAGNIPSKAHEHSVSNALTSYNNYALISTERNERILVGEIDKNNILDIERYLLYCKIRKIDCIILTDRVNDINSIKYFAKKFFVDDFYFLDYQNGYDTIIRKYIADCNITDVKTGIEYSYKNYSLISGGYTDGRKSGVVIKINNSDIVYLNRFVSNINLQTVYNINKAKVLIAYSKEISGAEYDYLLCQNAHSSQIFNYLHPNENSGKTQSVVLK